MSSCRGRCRFFCTCHIVPSLLVIRAGEVSQERRRDIHEAREASCPGLVDISFNSLGSSLSVMSFSYVFSHVLPFMCFSHVFRLCLFLVSFFLSFSCLFWLSLLGHLCLMPPTQQTSSVNVCGQLGLPIFISFCYSSKVLPRFYKARIPS